MSQKFPKMWSPRCPDRFSVCMFIFLSIKSCAFSWRFQSARKKTDPQFTTFGVPQSHTSGRPKSWRCNWCAYQLWCLFLPIVPTIDCCLGERWSSSPADFIMSLDAFLRVEEKRCWLQGMVGFGPTPWVKHEWLGWVFLTAYMWHVYIVNVNICKYHIVVVYCVNVNILYICIQHVRLIICGSWSLILPSVCIFHLDQTRDIQKFSRIQWLDMIYWKPKGSFQHESLFGCVNCLFELFTQWMLDPSKHVYFATAMAMYRE